MTTQTVTSSDEHYVSPILGNGEIVTTIGPTGYHDDLRPAHEHENRTLVWAGRRMNTPTNALIRFGKIQRTLLINGEPTNDEQWSQMLDYDQGIIVSTLKHSAVTEITASRICSNDNIMIIETILTNHADEPINLTLRQSYQFPTAPHANLNFPMRSHFGGVDSDTQPFAPHKLHSQLKEKGFSVLYDINQHLGEVRIGHYPLGDVEINAHGGHITHQHELAPHAMYTCWLWVMLSDRQHFTHFPYFTRLPSLLGDHESDWRNFWEQSSVDIKDESRLTEFRQSCLYAIRCNASPWSIPPAYLPTYWEGRTFHDELYPFLGLLSSGYSDLAHRIPTFRLNTLPVALRYGGGKGARYPWETLESGEEGGPYGAWMDERFHIGQFVETVWRYYLYTTDRDALRRFYPVMRESTRFFIHDVLVRDQQGILKTRLVTDFDEAIYPVDNGIFTLCSVIRTLHTTASAAGILQLDENDRAQWIALAEELKPALPHDSYYQVADVTVAGHWHIAQMGSIFPFSFDIDSDIAINTMSELYQALKTEKNVKPGSAKSYNHTHWMWVASMIATGFFYQGRGDEGYALLVNILNSVGPFLSCNEQHRLRPDEDLSQQYRLPWFTTSAGAFVYAMNSMWVQVDEAGTTLFKGLPSHLNNVRFSRLLASNGIRVSATLDNGQLHSLLLESDTPQAWTFRIPQMLVQSTRLLGEVDERGYVLVTNQLNTGDNKIV